MAEVLIILCILWMLGIIFSMFAFGELMKDDPQLADMLRMNAEMNPVGIVLLSVAIVFWPFTLLLRVMSKR